MVSLNNILLEYIPDADGGFPIKERIDRIQQIRIDFACVEGLLATGIPNHTSIGVQVHLSVGAFEVSTHFKKEIGCTPLQYRSNLGQ